MSNRVRVAVAGLGRMGQIHALHAYELSQETQLCELTAICDLDSSRAQRFRDGTGSKAEYIPSVEQLAASSVCDAVVLVTQTGEHGEHAWQLVSSGKRVLLEKPLTGELRSDRRLSALLDREAPNGLMLAFQRRFDPPLQYAKELMDSGVIGRVFRIYSALEDSNPAPNGYVSGGILADMSVHNVDEVLWLYSDLPHSAAAIGSRVYSYKLTTCDEDFDDAILYLSWPDERIAEIQVSRNHVSGYRTETILFGEEGQIHVGHFDQKLQDITVEAYGRRGRTEPITHRTFPMRRYGRELPEFADRFGPAYKGELMAFLKCCQTGMPFPVTHRDGLRAQQVITAGMQAVIGRDKFAVVHL